MLSDIKRVVLAMGQSLPAGGTRARWCQSISQTLAAEHMSAFGGNDQSAAIYNLQTSTVRSEDRIQPTIQVRNRCVEGYLTVRVQADRTANRPWSWSEKEYMFPIQSSFFLSFYLLLWLNTQHILLFVTQKKRVWQLFCSGWHRCLQCQANSKGTPKLTLNLVRN